MKKLRLLKVLVQPVFVIDDGETLAEVQAQAGVVAAADWTGYATGLFVRQAAEFEASLNGGTDKPDPPADPAPDAG